MWNKPRRRHSGNKRESVNRTQMDIKCKTCDIRTLKKKHFFSTYPPPTLILLSHRFTSASKPAALKSFDCCFSHFRISVSTASSATNCQVSRPSCEPLYATNTFHLKQKTFIYEYHLRWVLLPTKKAHNRTLFFGSILLKHGRYFDSETSIWICACASAM
jgi:hypothetical protein